MAVLCLGYDQQVDDDWLEKELKKRGLKDFKIVRAKAYKPEVYKSSKLKKWTDYKKMKNVKLTADIVVFTKIRNKLNVLLIKRKKPPFKGEFCLPGGHIDEGETPKHAASRELMEETCISNNSFKKIGIYDQAERDPRGNYVTFAFMAEIDAAKNKPKAGSDAMTAEWVPIDEIKTLGFDHKTIIEDALEKLKSA